MTGGRRVCRLGGGDADTCIYSVDVYKDRLSFFLIGYRIGCCSEARTIIQAV